MEVSQFRANFVGFLKSCCVFFYLFIFFFCARAVPSCCLQIGSWCQSMWWSPSPCGRRTCHSHNLDREVMSACWPSREMSTEFLHYALTAPLCSVRTHRWACLKVCFTCPCLLWPLPQQQDNLLCFAFILTSGIYISSAFCHLCVFKLLW